jgi:hypothetical protein
MADNRNVRWQGADFVSAKARDLIAESRNLRSAVKAAVEKSERAIAQSKAILVRLRTKRALN